MRADISEVNQVWVVYDEMFMDKLTISLLYTQREEIEYFCDEQEKVLSRFDVARWVMQKWYGKIGMGTIWWQGRYIEDPGKLYNSTEEYRKAVDEERLYLLHLLKIPVVDIADCFGVSRQTVYSRIKAFEKNRLQEFIGNYWV